MMEHLTLKEHMMISEADELRKRRTDLKYVEKEAKKQVEKVIVELNGAESGVLTKLASRYERLDKAIKVMTEKKNELNADIKAKVEDLFAAEDVILTRVIETCSFTLTVSKREKQDDKTTVDYEAIAKALQGLITEELQPQVDEIIKTFTVIEKREDKSPALRVKAKVNEGLLSDLAASVVSLIKKMVKSVASWAPKFDKKLAAVKKLVA